MQIPISELSIKDSDGTGERVLLAKQNRYHWLQNTT